MHVDAFFEYLLHKSHAYWTQIPSAGDTPSEFGRDGVSPEEDLALRALLPETRPKRGRRKAEDRDNDSDLARSPAQKPRIHSPTPPDDFGIGRAPVIDTPASARPDFVMNSGQLGPWSANDVRLSYGAHATGGHQNYISAQSPSVQWRPRDSDQTPFTPHPHSAITPRTRNPFLPYDDEPQSAVTPSKSRSRRRHGPAVSSAWPSSGNTAAGKLRGRPPSNRSISDGPFSTFPANPNAKTGPNINFRDTPALTPTVENSSVRNSSFIFPPPLPSNRPAAKPSGLHLQVPERKGGAVRLATPPPTLLVNGESEADAPADETLSREQESTPTMDCLNCTKTYVHFDPDAMLTTDDGISQNNEPLSRAHQFTNLSSRDGPGEDRTSIDMVELQFVYATLHADWYNNDGQPTERCSLNEAYRIASQIVCKLRDESSSKEAFLMNLAALAGGRSLGMLLKFTRLENSEDANNYRAKWTMKYGPVEGSFDLKISVPRRPPTRPQEPAGDGPETEASEIRTTNYWKNKYVELHGRIRESDQKIKELRKNVLEALLVASQDSDA
jgi:ARS binding protein 2